MIDNRARALSAINDSQLEDVTLQLDGNLDLPNMSQNVIDAFNGAGTIPPLGSVKSTMLDGFVQNSIYPFDGKDATMESLSASDRLKYRNAVLDVKIVGADQSKRYALSRIGRNVTGAYSIYLQQLNDDYSNGTIVATFYNSSYVEPETKIDIVPLTQLSSSGIYGYVVIDWSQLTDGASISFNTVDIKLTMLDRRTHVTNINTTNIEVVLPPTIYNVVGSETNVYFENVTLCNDLNDFQVNVICSIGKHKNECFRTNGLNGTYTLTIEVYRDGYLLAKDETEIVSKDASVGSGVDRKGLFIGDSTTEAGYITSEILAIQDADVMKTNLIGTHGSELNKHEGIGGWKVHTFYTDVTSPFVFDGYFDFAQYMSTNSYADLDYVTINLGINDVFDYTDDVSLNTGIVTILNELDAMITNIHEYDATIKVGVCVTIPPSYYQDSFNASYNTGQTRWRYKRNQFLFSKALIIKFKERTAEQIYVVPINVALDTVNNMSIGSAEAINSRNSATVVRQANGVHPATIGYYQIADAIWAWLKCMES